MPVDEVADFAVAAVAKFFTEGCLPAVESAIDDDDFLLHEREKVDILIGRHRICV